MGQSVKQTCLAATRSSTSRSVRSGSCSCCSCCSFCFLGAACAVLWTRRKSVLSESLICWRRALSACGTKLYRFEYAPFVPCPFGETSKFDVPCSWERGSPCTTSGGRLVKGTSSEIKMLTKRPSFLMSFVNEGQRVDGTGRSIETHRSRLDPSGSLDGDDSHT